MNWKERIDAAREQGHFTSADMFQSLDWKTCAACELNIERQTTHMGLPVEMMPEDKVIMWLGCSFAAAVNNNDFDGAEEIWRRMHERADELVLEASVVTVEEETPEVVTV